MTEDLVKKEFSPYTVRRNVRMHIGHNCRTYCVHYTRLKHDHVFGELYAGCLHPDQYNISYDSFPVSEDSQLSMVWTYSMMLPIISIVAIYVSTSNSNFAKTARGYAKLLRNLFTSATH